MPDDERPDDDLTHVSDERIIVIARGHSAKDDATISEAVSMAHELKWRRAKMREDSRAAQQIKRLRWVAESLVTKVEQLRIDEESHRG